MHERHRAGAHGEDVAHDTADTGCGALVGLDEARVIMALHLEDGRLPVANIDDARVLAGAADHLGAGRRQGLQVQAGGLVGAVLTPHHGEDAELHRVRLPPEPLEDQRVFLRLKAVVSGQFGHGLGGGAGAHGGFG